ncbi:Putative multidrug export ATP-binding/permease protein SAV1866 [uncultured Clostridium sp.]|uniref:ABC transporter ATP-binding protein n=1 Tax=uncultured Clostridium sp. TaxID=59620 RepID=UPI0008230FE3|nr:ABC transporter ATP-binding protein [uncultured Clostridium sp.]SCI81935.1 Putative multidrug export ATP-binding/permease protein SAV1866 [uncultured Clostridium sp.]
MKKILKHLKPFIGAIFVSFVLLFVQAICDLSLPDYMSNIVDIGIQQGGVDNAVPEVIRASEFDKLLIFMNDEDKSLVKNSYILLDKNTLSSEDYDKYIKKYPELENQNLYKLDTKNKEDIKNLNNIMGKPIMITMMFEEQAEAANNPDSSASENTSNPMADLLEKMPPGTDIFQMLSAMPKDQLDSMLSKIDTQMESTPEMMVTQAATNYIKTEYNAIGINTDKLQSNYIIVAGAKMLGIALISMAATVAVGFIAARLAAALGRNLRKDVFTSVVGFSNNEFDHFSTASLITRSTNDIQQIQVLVVMLIRTVFYAPILGAGGILKVLGTKTNMGWIIGVAVLALLTVVSVLFGLVLPKSKLVQKLLDKVNLVTRESLTGMLVIRAFSTQKYEEKKFDKANKDLTKTNLFVTRMMGMMMPMMMLIMNGISLLIVWVGAHRINDGVLQVGNMMAFIQYTMQIIMSFLMISMISVILPRAAASVQRIAEVLSTDVSIKDIESPKKFNNDEKGVVEFKNVSFRYPGAEEDVLENINFIAKPGETTAFIGSTGSGKSTLINLIPRFYDATEGEILVDGVNIKDVSQHDLREKIGYVPQKGILFSGTIESNLKYGDENLSEEGMIKAAKVAQAMEFISSKESGFNTEISQGGTNVSGGQKQRLSIARALAKNPEIFIFDDSFSALDFKTDATLRKALKAETAASTMLIVAQRISTIMNAEQIIVLDEGKVVGKGTHSELMKNCEVYKQIALSQLSKEELEHE